jgi:hypothetical protein
MRDWKDDATNVLLVGYIILIICAIISILSCNPVKQVLKDKNKLDKVAEVVVQSGYCANDTTIITKSDTTTITDTIFDTQVIIDEVNKTDTQYVKVPKVITRTITIRDTIKNVVVDNARVVSLEKKIEKQGWEVDKWKSLARARWWYLFWIILFTIVYLLRKSILRFIRWQFVKF